MKFALNIIICAVAACAVASAASFAELRGEYAKALERIDAAEAKKLEELKTQYAKTLDKGVVYYMRKGELKSTLALRDERERFEQEGTIPPAISRNGRKKAEKAPSPDGTNGLQPVPWDEVDDGVIRTIKRCRQRWLAINQYADRQRLELNKYYAEQLEPVEKRLTRQGRLDQALAVSKERERVAGEITRLDKLVPEEREEPEPSTSESDSFGTLARLPDDLKENVVAYYSFEDTGTRVRDRTGNGHDGRSTEMLNYVRGTSGKAIYFDGDGPLLKLPKGKMARSLDGAEAVSFAMWIRPDRLSSESPAEAPIAFSTKNQSTKSGMVLIINQSSTVFGGTAAEDGRWTDVRASPVAAKTWHHVAGTFDFRGGRLNLYINGRHAETAEFSVPLKAYTDHGGQRYHDTLGGASGSDTRNFQGAFDELLFFRTGLTESDAATLAKMRGD